MKWKWKSSRAMTTILHPLARWVCVCNLLLLQWLKSDIVGFFFGPTPEKRCPLLLFIFSNNNFLLSFWLFGLFGLLAMGRPIMIDGTACQRVDAGHRQRRLPCHRSTVAWGASTGQAPGKILLSFFFILFLSRERSWLFWDVFCPMSYFVCLSHSILVWKNRSVSYFWLNPGRGRCVTGVDERVVTVNFSSRPLLDETATPNTFFSRVMGPF